MCYISILPSLVGSRENNPPRHPFLTKGINTQTYVIPCALLHARPPRSQAKHISKEKETEKKKKVQRTIFKELDLFAEHTSTPSMYTTLLWSSCGVARLPIITLQVLFASLSGNKLIIVSLIVFAPCLH